MYKKDRRRYYLTSCCSASWVSQRISSIFEVLTQFRKMKKIHIFLLFSLAVLTASSQKVYFVYIQTESEQPFFVKMNEKVNSSTASGYIILSKLLDSTYSFNVGFPQNKWPEQNFSISVGKKDHGYLLKNFGEKGWGLFDLQTLAVQMSSNNKTSLIEKPKVENNDVSPFTEILSKAADDPSLKEKPAQEVAKKEEPKIEVKEVVIAKPVEAVEQPIAKKEEPKVEIKEVVVAKPAETIEQPIIKKEEPKAEIKEVVIAKPVEAIDQPVAQSEETKTIIVEPYKTSQVKKWSESSTTEGFGLVFIDDYENGIRDTIRLVIPNPKPVVNMAKEEPKEEKKFIDINTETAKKEELPVVTENKIAEAKQVFTETAVEKAAPKNNCNELASESDFFKLRKKMAAEENDDNMISEARKIFKIKCFTSAQLKNLSTLFLNDEGKYKFFDVAYKYVSDAEAFTTLQSELKDEYYASRFKAMLRN
jgi:hypothetical protein